MKSVLVIDDEPAIRTVLKRVLEKAGYTVRLAANGVEGLESLEAQISDIVITDIIMPTMHGVDAIKAIAQKFPTVRISATPITNPMPSRPRPTSRLRSWQALTPS